MGCRIGCIPRLRVFQACTALQVDLNLRHTHTCSHIDTYRIIQMSKQAITKTGPENNREKPSHTAWPKW
jgi:hypothetical protein